MAESTFAARIHDMMQHASTSQGPLDMLFEKYILTFADDSLIEVRAGDIRTALRAARGETV